MDRLRTFRIAAALLLMASVPDIAAAKGMSLKQLQALLTDLGYEPVAKDDNRVAVEDQGQFKRDISFALNGDTGVLNIYVPLAEVADDKKAMIPGEALLRANDGISPFAYALVSVEGKPRLDIEGSFDTATVTKPMLRRTIDALIAATDAGEPLWSTEHWSAAAASEPSLDAARAALVAAWERSPLRIQHGTFVTQSAPSYGDYVPRTGQTFKPGEAMAVYMEPEGYRWKALDGDTTSTDISIDMLLSDRGGAVVADKKAFLVRSIRSRGNFFGLFLNVDLHLTGLPEGSYQVRFTLHDLNSDKSAELTLPFQIAN